MLLMVDLLCSKQEYGTLVKNITYIDPSQNISYLHDTPNYYKFFFTFFLVKNKNKWKEHKF